MWLICLERKLYLLLPSFCISGGVFAHCEVSNVARYVSDDIMYVADCEFFSSQLCYVIKTTMIIFTRTRPIPCFWWIFHKLDRMWRGTACRLPLHRLDVEMETRLVGVWSHQPGTTLHTNPTILSPSMVMVYTNFLLRLRRPGWCWRWSKLYHGNSPPAAITV